MKISKTDSISWAVQALDAIPEIGRQSAERVLTETAIYHMLKDKAEGSCLYLHPVKAIDILIAQCYPTYKGGKRCYNICQILSWS